MNRFIYLLALAGLWSFSSSAYDFSFEMDPESLQCDSDSIYIEPDGGGIYESLSSVAGESEDGQVLIQAQISDREIMLKGEPTVTADSCETRSCQVIRWGKSVSKTPDKKSKKYTYKKGDKKGKATALRKALNEVGVSDKDLKAFCIQSKDCSGSCFPDGLYAKYGLDLSGGGDKGFYEASSNYKKSGHLNNQNNRLLGCQCLKNNE